MFPHRFDFIVGERKAAGGRYWIRSQKFGEAPVYYIHFKGEPVKVAPQVLDGRLGAIPKPLNWMWPGFPMCSLGVAFMGPFPNITGKAGSSMWILPSRKRSKACLHQLALIQTTIERTSSFAQTILRRGHWQDFRLPSSLTVDFFVKSYQLM